VLGTRSAFSRLSWDIYLSHAAVAPLPDRGYDAVMRATDALATRGAGAIMDLMGSLDTVRARLISFGQLPGEVAFVGNTSQALTAVALGLDWNPGNTILLFEGEFPSNITPWQRAAELYGLEIRVAPIAAAESAAALEPYLTGVRLVSLSTVQFQTGFAAPVPELAKACHAAGALLAVDAIQSLGIVPIDLRDADFVAAGGHKWLLAPFGTGVLSCKDWGRLRPVQASWLSLEEPFDFLGRPNLNRRDKAILSGPSQIEGGVASVVALAGLDASSLLLETTGVQAIFDHVQAFHDAVEQSLVDMGFVSHRHPTGRSGILSLTPPPGHTAQTVHDLLAEKNIAVSTPEGLVRLSPGIPTRAEDAPALLQALAGAL